METPPITPVIRKPSQVMAWLGFGISLAVLVIIWIVNALVFTHIGERDYPIAALYMLVFLVGGFLGLMGLIFSIVGLVSALRNFSPKWPAVCGIVFCCLSLLSVFAPVIIASTIKSETIKVETPESVIASETNTSEVVVLYITDMNRMKCYDNRHGIDNNPAVINMFSIDKKHELQTWMEINGIKNDANFTLKTDEGVEYSNIVEILDIFKELGITKFRLASNNAGH